MRLRTPWTDSLRVVNPDCRHVSFVNAIRRWWWINGWLTRCSLSILLRACCTDGVQIYIIGGPRFETSVQVALRCSNMDSVHLTVWSGPKLTEILHVFAPKFFEGSAPPPNFWRGIIKFSQIPTIRQSFRAIGRGTSENAWRKKEKKTSRVKHKSYLSCQAFRSQRDASCNWGVYCINIWKASAKLTQDKTQSKFLQFSYC